jgi:replication-associated recombination protein RarA
LAWCIAKVTQANYVAINATISNVEELRKIIAVSKLRAKEGKKKTERRNRKRNIMKL